VYRELGDYGTIIPSWLDHPGVLAFVDESEEPVPQRRGFTLVGFYTPSSAEDRGEDHCVADLLAIAIAPEFQRKGLGTSMLRHAIGVAGAARAQRDVPEMRLTVAEGNDGARELFERHGFRVVNEKYGSYDGGQRALRMRLLL